MRYSKVQFVVFAGVFIALTVIFTHIFAIQATFIRVSFGFLPIAFFAAMFGAWRGGCMAAIADLIGALLFTPGLLFPGFTLSAFCSGFIYGQFFYQKPPTLPRIVLAMLCVSCLIDLGLNTLWLTLLYHKAASVFFVSRFVRCIILLPLQTILFYSAYKSLYHHRLFR